MRLNRFLSLSGIASRRKCDELISKGKVLVNDQVVSELGSLINPKKDRVRCEGKAVKLPNEFSYYILNKPRGYLTSLGDPHQRQTIDSLISSIKERVFHVGRLDKDSEGLLLLTNDGKIAHRLLHPKYHVSKKYKVEVNGFLPDQDIIKLKSGIKLEEGKTNPSEIELINRTKTNTQFYISINQGWNRQIRRMLEVLGFEVIYLQRIAFGDLKLENVPLGQWRKLSSQELKSLKRLVKLP